MPKKKRKSDRFTKEFTKKIHSLSLEALIKKRLEPLLDQQSHIEVHDSLYKVVLGQVEKPLIELSLQAYSGNQVKAAKMLGINRNTLKKKIDNYQIVMGNHKEISP